MRNILIVLIIPFFISSCGNSDSYVPKNAVEIYSGENPMTKLWGWVIVGTKVVYTSAHVLNSDTRGYVMIHSGAKIPLKLLLRDGSTDEGFLEISKQSEKEMIDFFTSFREDISERRKELRPGSVVMAELVSSGKAIVKTGKVIDIQWKILTLDNKWWVWALTGVLLTDIVFKEGESGSPIYNADWELVDVVHVK